ncbi:NADH dehydrogenase [ubiquinone] 1 alpha subcomplex subunit [Elysia marginata]|uniref:NADH dehydrogenase [ubiquinone] 1 alpha subcomplex subunit 7 n=1 Tax=Elysia marginata TaxID=1093978 RepID=A0AAV4G2U8_9GAST|nr:NADH dehydrogenase [ubiquinone] 1 alpha subcomplex subunit [Elysia marginata]
MMANNRRLALQAGKFEQITPFSLERQSFMEKKTLDSKPQTDKARCLATLQLMLEVLPVSYKKLEIGCSVSQPKPSIPPGVSSKLADNYYYTRDGRREVQQPTVVYNASQKMLEGGEAASLSKAPLPGVGYDWETGKPALSSK